MKFFVLYFFCAVFRSHPARGAWIEMEMRNPKRRRSMSHPARGAWIEMADVIKEAVNTSVAPRKGCVD